MEFGPVQLLVVGSRTASSRARYWPSYDASGSTTSSGWSTFYSSLRMRTAKSRRSNRDLSKDESEAFGGLAGALLGMGAAGEEGAEAGAALGAMTLDERGSVIDPDDLWYMADAIPTGTSAGIALLEHRWAIPLRDAIERAGGKTLVDSSTAGFTRRISSRQAPKPAERAERLRNFIPKEPDRSGVTIALAASRALDFIPIG